MKKILISVVLFFSLNLISQTCFTPITNYSVATNPNGGTSADFNGDGKLDLAVTNAGSNSISILLGSVSGTFTAATNYSVGSYPIGITHADFNSDGNVDLAVANVSSDNICVLIGNGSGGFTAPVYYPAGGVGPRRLAAEDFDNDGKIDIALVNLNSSNVAIFINSGTGTFGAATTYPSGNGTSDLSIADFNGDGKKDIVVSNWTSDDVRVLLGNSGGTFLAAVSYTIGDFVPGVTTGDFNNDGFVDICANAKTSNYLAILLGNGTGTFTAVSSTISAVSPSSVHSYDFNGDGFIDLVSTYPNLGRLYVYPGNGTGTFPYSTYFSVGSFPYHAFMGDFNADGKMDLASPNSTSNNVSILLGSTIPSLNITATPTAVCVGAVSNLTVTSGFSAFAWSTGATASFINVAPSITTIYKLSATKTNGCQNTASISVLVNPTPTLTVSNATICSGQSHTIVPSGASTYTTSGGSFVVSPVTTQNYVITGTSAAGCNSASKTITITVNPKPIISVNSGSICSGKSFTINPTGATSYTYSSGSNIVSPILTTTYSVLGSNTFGCFSNPVTNTVTVFITPTISVNSGSICSGKSFTLIPSGASTYTYSSGSAVVSPTTSTTYTVIGKSSAGCISANTVTSTIVVETSPTIAVNSGSICSSNSFTLVPTGASTYSYLPSGPIISPMSTLSYSVIGTATNGCISANTAVTSITVSASPTISVNNGTICAGKSFTINPTGATTYSYSSGTSIVSPTISSTYSVTGTSALGCLSTNTTVSSIIVNSLPTVSVNSGTICSGSSFTFIPLGASTYTISGGLAVVSPTTTTSYSVIGTSSLGCVSSNTVIGLIHVLNSPTVNLSSSNSIICIGTSAILTATGGDTYLWNTSATTNTIFVSPTSSTTYTAIATGTNGCTTNAAITQSVQLCTGLTNSVGETLIVNISPNPSNGLFNLSSNEIGDLFLFNFYGDLILSEKKMLGNYNLDLSNYSSGLYFLQFINQSKTINLKLLKQ